MKADYHHRFLSYLDEDRKTDENVKVTLDSYSSVVRIYHNNKSICSIEILEGEIIVFERNERGTIVASEIPVSKLFIDPLIKVLLHSICKARKADYKSIKYYLDDIRIDQISLIDVDLGIGWVGAADLITETVIDIFNNKNVDDNVLTMRELDIYDDFLDFYQSVKDFN